MTLLHVSAPRAMEVRLVRVHCPTCGRRRWMTVLFYEWYGFTVTCLRCGENWADGERRPRPCAPKWRQKSIEAARRRYREARDRLRKG